MSDQRRQSLVPLPTVPFDGVSDADYAYPGVSTVLRASQPAQSRLDPEGWAWYRNDRSPPGTGHTNIYCSYARYAPELYMYVPSG